MLVLTRKLMETLYIGDDIAVTVVRIEPGQVRLGIEAPSHINVLRKELVMDSDPRHQKFRTQSKPITRIPNRD